MAGGKGPHQNIGGDSSFTTTSLATMGDKGSTKLKPTAPENRTHWKAGTSVEVAWGIRYNHGGGYQYRLCPANQPLTEDCMQKMPLEFDRTEGTSLVWNNGSRYKIENVFVSEGTWPKGSTWARNPIPRVNDDNIGQHDPDACKGPLKHYTPGCIQFPPVCPQDTGRMPWSTDGSGQGACSGDWTAGLIADRVIIPKTLPPGDYVLGWRWDCTHTCTCITPPAPPAHAQASAYDGSPCSALQARRRRKSGPIARTSLSPRRTTPKRADARVAAEACMGVIDILISHPTCHLGSCFIVSRAASVACAQRPGPAWRQPTPYARTQP